MLIITNVLANFQALPVINYDPFKKAQVLLQVKPVKKTVSKPKVVIKLAAIMNDRAYINGHFYKKGDKLFGYRLVKVYDDYVVLNRGDIYKVVSLEASKFIRMQPKEETTKEGELDNE